MNYLMNGLAALAFIVLFSQCAGKTDNQTTNAPAQANAELSCFREIFRRFRESPALHRS